MSLWPAGSCAGRIRGCMTQLSHIEGDRKSTRLNSSHSQISYAVFCLKKKTTTFQKRITFDNPATLMDSQLRDPASLHRELTRNHTSILDLAKTPHLRRA